MCPGLATALECGRSLGEGWPQPRVVSGPGRVATRDIVGDGQSGLLMGSDGARLKAMAFRAGDTPLGLALASAQGRWCFVAGRVKRDDWGRTPAAELHLDDLAWADA